MNTPATGLAASKCILVTGATSGIGRALALELAKLPSKPTVIGAGRRKDRLTDLEANGIIPFSIDLASDVAHLKAKVEELVSRYPHLDAIILNAGVQNEVHFEREVDMTKVAQEIQVNYLSVFAMINAILPHFRDLASQKRNSFIVTVTSGLAIIPGAPVANYSASKAALHSLTMSLRAQLEALGPEQIKVIEISPPLVESELHDAEGTTDRLSKFWVPLSEYIPVTVDALVRGDEYVSYSNARDWYAKFDEGKMDVVREMTRRFMPPIASNK